MQGRGPRLQIVISPPDDKGCLLAPLLVTQAQAAEALGINARELQRLVDRRVVDLVHLGPRRGDILVKAESLRRAFGVRVLYMRPEKPRLPPTHGQEGLGQRIAVPTKPAGEPA